MTRHSQWCEEGKYLCCLCFGCFTLDELSVIEDGPDAGLHEDVCVPCRAMEKAAKP